MPNPKNVTKRQRKAVHNYVKKGYSANRIQKRLRARHIGMRRTVLLSEIRKVKNQTPKANRLKYTPKKYRRMTSSISHPSRERRQIISGRQVAVYGYARTKKNPRAYSARFEFYGSGKDLQNAVMLAYEGFVPRREWAFVKCHAKDFLNNPEKFGERGAWSGKPEIES